MTIVNDNYLRIEAPIKFDIKVVGKIDLSKIDNTTRPKTNKPPKQEKRNYFAIPKNRNELDSGWGVSFLMLQRNYKKQIKKNDVLNRIKNAKAV